MKATSIVFLLLASFGATAQRTTVKPSSNGTVEVVILNDTKKVVTPKSIRLEYYLMDGTRFWRNSYSTDSLNTGNRGISRSAGIKPGEVDSYTIQGGYPPNGFVLAVIQ